MPFDEHGDGRIYYETTGPETAPTLVFSNSLGTNLSMWDAQVARLERDFRILRYDTRGHGQSSVTPGPYTIAQLTGDVSALLDQLGMKEVCFCGLSMGGMIGMLLALREPKRVRKLVLCSTAAKIGTGAIWDARIAAVRNGGMSAVVEGVLERWFTAGYRAGSPDAIEPIRHMLLASHIEGYVANCEAVRDFDARESIAGIRVATLILSGTYDPAATPADGRFMAERIAGAVYRELPAAHLSNIEVADAFTGELEKFLKA
jgi:3-oxoadipate enol-lactonase